MTSTYYVILTTRNPESEECKRTISSINAQTIPPKELVVIHDQEPTIDFSRIPLLWNKGLRKGYDFILIMADDLELEPTYAERILRRIMTPLAVIASGDIEPFLTGAPQGGGRFIRQKWFDEQYPGGFPHLMGYESEILDRAIRQGKYIFCFNDVHMIHLRPLGKYHNFSEFGQSMTALGYHPLFAIWRCFDMMRNPNVGVRGGINTLWYYLTYRPKREGYYSVWDENTRSWYRKTTKRQFMAKIRLIKRS